MYSEIWSNFRACARKKSFGDIYSFECVTRQGHPYKTTVARHININKTAEPKNTKVPRTKSFGKYIVLSAWAVRPTHTKRA